MNCVLAYPYGSALTTGRLKEQAADFKVTENLGFEPSGEGEHLFLLVKKAGMSTHELIDAIARDFKLKPRDIGYSGLKDKLAVTQQWLSLHLPGQMHQFNMPEIDAYTILQQSWHHRKLKPGTHRTNSFEVIVRNLEGFTEDTERQINAIKSAGMANYFGQQRFGERLDNVSRALQIFSNPRKTRKLSRNKKGIYLSSLRSHLFNQILSSRIDSGYWQEPIEGDVYMLSGSQSIFYEALNDDIRNRYKSFDLSSSASLFGDGNSKLADKAQAIEEQVFSGHPEIVDCLRRLKAKLQMRPVRVAVEDLNVEYQEKEKTLLIKATLPSGSYFTTLLDHFIDTRDRS
ncbi:MAG: tRNA pseudouridine(13) synthase TruD [Gammaproteobacteria bacterium]|nr:tRNA pseudouridine(13) synthase TruD [Gammaproteobacteria bacterium]